MALAGNPTPEDIRLAHSAGSDICSVCGVELWDEARQRPTLAGSNTFYSNLCTRHCIEHVENLAKESREKEIAP